MLDRKEIPAAVPEICVIAPSEELANNTKKVCAQMGCHNVGTFVAVLDDGLKVAEVVRERGARVLVSRKGTAFLLEKRSGMQVVQIRTTMNDYLRHIHLMKEHRGKLGIVEYETFIPEIEKLCNYIELKQVTLYGYKDMADYRQKARQAILDQNTLLIGGGALLPQYAKKAGIPHQIVENTLDSIRYALETAQQIVALQKSEQKKRREYQLTSERLAMILNHTHDGILSVDEQGQVQVANDAALTMLQATQEECTGKGIGQILPGMESRAVVHFYSRVLKLKGTQVSVDHIPVLMDGSAEGALYIMRSVKDVQQSERSIRMQLYKKGNAARYRFDDIIGESPALTRVKHIARSYAQAESTILLDGETGTGKELFAQSIHNASRRADGPFVAINCASLGKELLESQLFGYVEGAFTGAARGGHPGLFEIAHGGTIFLDEIGEIPMETQTQLLRVLQEKEIRRIGSDHVLPVDVRVITATNRDLAQEVEAGRFRKDLYYRINILKLTIPPLRERRGDAVLIARHFLKANFPREEEQVMEYLYGHEKLLQYEWPGNVRELLGMLERMVTLLQYGDINELDATLPVRTAEKPFGEEKARGPREEEAPGRLAREEIELALRQCRYSRSRAAQLLGCSRSTLWRYMKQYGLDRPR